MNPFAALIEPVQAPRETKGRVHYIDPEDGDSLRERKALGGKRKKFPRFPHVMNPWDLAPTQTHIASLLTLGLTNGQIAADMGLSIKTVEQHTKMIRDAMDAPNRTRIAVLWDRFIRGKEGQPC